jgi:hypothetical protein
MTIDHAGVQGEGHMLGRQFGLDAPAPQRWEYTATVGQLMEGLAKLPPERKIFACDYRITGIDESGRELSLELSLP